jgi:hypothetical protein
MMILSYLIFRKCWRYLTIFVEIIIILISNSEVTHCPPKTAFFTQIGEECGSDHVRDRLLRILEPPTDDVERFLAMLRFPSREKLKDLPLI